MAHLSIPARCPGRDQWISYVTCVSAGFRLTRRAAARPAACRAGVAGTRCRAGPGVQSWAGSAGRVRPGVQRLAEAAPPGRMDAQIPAGTAARGIPHVQWFRVRAFRREDACTIAGHERCRSRDARAFSRSHEISRQLHVPEPGASGVRGEFARASSWRQRHRAHACTCRIRRACCPPEIARALSRRQRRWPPVCACMLPAAGRSPTKCTSWLAAAATAAGICTGPVP
jgi:hypothetical protein